MSVQHKDLTGAQLHEPKGISTAAAGTVYIADGAGSGVWTQKNADLLNANTYNMSDTLADIGTANDSVFFYVPQKSKLSRVSCVLYGAIATTDTILSFYINGVLFGTTLTVPIAGSAAGVVSTVAIGSPPTITAGQTVEVRTDGATTSTVKASITITLTNSV